VGGTEGEGSSVSGRGARVVEVRLGAGTRRYEDEVWGGGGAAMVLVGEGFLEAGEAGSTTTARLLLCLLKAPHSTPTEPKKRHIMANRMTVMPWVLVLEWEAAGVWSSLTRISGSEGTVRSKGISSMNNHNFISSSISTDNIKIRTNRRNRTSTRALRRFLV
jgi:hypothetical protein